jgi:heterodisulfide reductase subunit A-like polyferredoxin
MRLLAVLLLFATGFVTASEQLTVTELKQRATAARRTEQPKLFLEIAERQLRAADDAYRGGNVEEGRAAVADVADSCEKAGLAATSARKHLKETEIRIRDLSRRLDSLRRILSFEDRAPVNDAIERMEKTRSDLLNAMFGLKS